MLDVSAAPDSTLETKESNGLITTTLGGRDLDFFDTLLVTGQLQLMLGELVKTKAESPRVKTVGGTLASTQAQENEEINRLATVNGITLSPTAAGAQRQISAELEKLTGTSFDIACVSKIVEANKETVRAYAEGSESKNPGIQSFSSQMLPIAKDRLRIAEMMIEGPEKPAGGPATPAPRTAPMQLRPTAPAPAKKPATPAAPIASPTPAAPTATPPPLTLGTTPAPAGQPSFATPSPIAPNADAQFLKESEPPAPRGSATSAPDSSKQP
jgi:predicted outer membrane protein